MIYYHVIECYLIINLILSNHLTGCIYLCTEKFGTHDFIDVGLTIMMNRSLTNKCMYLRGLVLFNQSKLLDIN